MYRALILLALIMVTLTTIWAEWSHSTGTAYVASEVRQEDHDYATVRGSSGISRQFGDLRSLQLVAFGEFGVPHDWFDSRTDVDLPRVFRDFLKREFRYRVQWSSIDGYSTTAGPESAAVLFGDSDDFAVVLGVIDDSDGNRSCQLLGPGQRCLLVPVGSLKDAGFREAATSKSAESDEKRTIPVRFGESSVELDRMWCAFGLIRPNEAITANFSIHNPGTNGIVIGKPKKTCGCTSVEPDDTMRLRPGETQTYEVTIKTGVGESFEHTVQLALFKRGGSDIHTLTLLFCGNVLESATLQPTSLDFGTLDEESTESERSFVISERPTDICRITSIQVRGLQLDHSIERRQLSSGLAENVVTVRCRKDQLTRGTHRGRIIVSTDSERRPQFVIPVRARVRGNVELIPANAAFGVVPTGQVASRTILVRVRNCRLTDVSLNESPKWCDCQLEKRGDDDYALHVRTRPTPIGFHHGRIVLSIIDAELAADTYDIDCSIFRSPDTTGDEND